MNSRISVLVVNLNNLDYTKNCINDLLNQDTLFNLTIIDQNSSEEGTSKYLDELFKQHIEGNFYGKIHVLSIFNTGYNKPLNHIWNEFVNDSDTEFICLLNNDVRLSPNFLSSSIELMDSRLDVGIISHTTNSNNYQSWSKTLEYVIPDSHYRQGWDMVFRKNLYVNIPEQLKFFYGDDFIFSKIYEQDYLAAYILNSPIIHYERSTTIEKNGFRDATPDYFEYNNIDVKYRNLTFNEKYSKWKPEFLEIYNEYKETFIKYNNIFLGQTPKTLECLKDIVMSFDTIIEVGFHRGGLSEWLNDNKKKESELYCYDITNKFLESKTNINFIISDCFNPNTIDEIENLIKSGKKTLLLCDGGNKEQEFNTFSKFLKNGDVIMIHDYCEKIDEFYTISSKVNWVAPPESHYKNIKESISTYNLKPYMYEKFKEVFWGSFIKNDEITLSILIPSLIERNELFLQKLLGNLNTQIKNKPVELIVFSDNANRPIGTKRNDLLKLAKGKYISFIDDDDRVSEDYVELILNEINSWSPDVVVFDAIISFDGTNEKLVKYGREFDYCEKPEAYYRHPNHLMVHKRENITEYFKDIKTGEDDEWAQRMLPRIVTQSRINKVLYYYDHNTNTKKYFE